MNFCEWAKKCFFCEHKFWVTFSFSILRKHRTQKEKTINVIFNVIFSKIKKKIQTGSIFWVKTLKEFREDKLWRMGLSRIYLVINIKIRQSFCSQSRIYPIKASVILSKRYSERGFNVINVFILVFIFLQWNCSF